MKNQRGFSEKAPLWLHNVQLGALQLLPIAGAICFIEGRIVRASFLLQVAFNTFSSAIYYAIIASRLVAIAVYSRHLQILLV